MIAQLRAIVILIVLAAAMILLGRFLGGLTAPAGPIPEQEVERLIRNLEEPIEKRADTSAGRALAGLAVRVTEAAHWPTVLQEIGLARQYGVQHFVFKVDLPWQGGPWPALERLGEAVASAESGAVWLMLDVNPGASWLEEHPDEVSTFVTQGAAYPSIGSARWRNDGSTAVFNAGKAVQEAFPNLHIAGVILGGLEEGLWYRTVGFDHSPANTAAFRKWLERRYETAAALAESWDIEIGSFEDAAVPDPPTSSERVLFAGPGDRPYVDYMEYLNGTTGSAVTFFAACARETFGANTPVFVQYGAMFDFPGPEHGQWALGKVLDEVDGIALGVHRASRSVGDVGGESGPSTVPGLRGKQWLLLDDTRTGIGWNATTNGVFKPAGFDLRTLSPIYDRNLLSAAMDQGGVFWFDARGQGNFADGVIWDYFVSRLPVIDELQHMNGDPSRTVLFVLDEGGIGYVADGHRFGNEVLNASRAALHQSGVSFGYVLLEDILRDRAPEARVFVFPNLFRLDEAVREQLHKYLADHGAAAIWLYAPGAASGEEAAESVGATVGMHVEAYSEPTPPESVYALTGHWIEENEKFGAPEPWSPLYYVSDESADLLARYTATEDGSAAVKFMDDGWASVFVATPTLTPGLLREILEILDHPPVVRNAGARREESFRIRNGYLLVHSREQGDRLFDFGDGHDVVDLLNPEMGWPGKQSLQFPMSDGSTRLLKITPSPRGLDERPGESGDEAPAAPEPLGAPPDGASIEEVPQNP